MSRDRASDARGTPRCSYTITADGEPAEPRRGPDNEWQIVQAEERQNEQLLEISNQILELTKAIHANAVGRSAGSS